MPRKYSINKLGCVQLWRLRQDVSLCSLYYNDYKNRYNLDVRTVCDFFDGYAEYLAELMQENGVDADAFFNNIDEYDNKYNLQDYYNNLFLICQITLLHVRYTCRH